MMRSLPCAAGLVGALLFAGILHPAVAAEPPRVRLDGPLLPGAWLQLMPFRTLGEPRVYRWTDGAPLALDGVPDGPALLCAGAQGRATRCVREWLEPGRTFAIPSPQPGLEVTGRVLLAKKPVAGAQIAVQSTDPTFPRFTLLPLAHDGRTVVSSVATAADGRFVLPRLAPGEYQLQVRAPGGRFGQLGPYPVADPARLRTTEPAAGTPRLDLGDLVLQEGAAVEVLVADTAGKPIAGADVSVTHLPAARTQTEGFLFDAKTDARGAAPFLGLPPGEGIEVVCGAAGYFPQARSLPAPEKTVRCTLSRPGRLEGKVVDPDGKPVAAATVALRARSGPSTRTGADGTFVLEDLNPGDHLLSVAAPRFRAAEREVSLAAEERRRLDPIQLTPAGGFAGRVIDGITEEPVAGAALTVQDPPGAGGAVADAEGAFTLQTEADEPLLLQVEAAGYPPTPLRISPEQQRSPEPVTVRLLPGGWIHVTVWNEAADAPCAGCWVLLTGPTGRGGRLTTDSRGEILTDLLAPGPYSLMALLRNGSDNSRTAHVKPGETVQVTFGDPRAVVEVVFTPSPPETWLLLAQTPTGNTLAERLPDGVFQVQRQAGEMKPLALTVPGELLLQLPVLAADFTEPALRLSLPSTQVQGVLMRDGGPLAGQRVELVSRRDGQLAAWIRTAPDGSFRLPHLPPGPYQLVVGNQPRADFEVAPGAPVELGAVVLDPT